MQESVVKRLVESYDVVQLTKTEAVFIEGEKLPFEIEGEDDREVLSHITAAIWIIEKMDSHDLQFEAALEEYKKS